MSIVHIPVDELTREQRQADMLLRGWEDCGDLVAKRCPSGGIWFIDVLAYKMEVRHVHSDMPISWPTIISDTRHLALYRVIKAWEKRQ